MKIASPEYRIIIATTILIFAMVVTILDGFKWFIVNTTIVVALIGFSSSLLGLGILKLHKNIKNE